MRRLTELLLLEVFLLVVGGRKRETEGGRVYTGSLIISWVWVAWALLGRICSSVVCTAAAMHALLSYSLDGSGAVLIYRRPEKLESQSLNPSCFLSL